MRKSVNILFLLLSSMFVLSGCDDEKEFRKNEEAIWMDGHGGGSQLEPAVNSGMSIRVEAMYDYRSQVLTGNVNFEQLDAKDVVTAIEFYGKKETIYSVKVRSKYTKGDIQNFTFCPSAQQLQSMKDNLCGLLVKTVKHPGGAALCQLTSCELDENTPTKVKKILWEGDIERFISGSKGDKVQLKVALYPEIATNKVLKWEIEDESIATMTQEGVLTMLKSGGATNLTVSTTDGSDLSLSVRVVVDFTPISSLLFQDDMISLVRGEEFVLPELTYKPDNASMKDLEWSIEDESVATFNPETRKLIAKTRGVTTLKAVAKDGFGAEITATIVVLDELPQPFYIASYGFTSGNNIYVESSTPDADKKTEFPQQVGSIKNNAYMYYGNQPVSLMGYRYITFRAAANNTAGGTITVRLDAKDGPVIASVEITPTRSDNQWSTFANFTSGKFNLTGVDLLQEHTLYLSFTAKGNCCNLHYIKLSVDK